MPCCSLLERLRLPPGDLGANDLPEIEDSNVEVEEDGGASVTDSGSSTAISGTIPPSTSSSFSCSVSIMSELNLFDFLGELERRINSGELSLEEILKLGKEAMGEKHGD